VTVVLRRACATPEEARRLRDALAPDDPKFLSLEVEGASLVARVSAASAGSVRATLEDLLACVGAAERALRGSP
jgi:hypothetical protein